KVDGASAWQRFWRITVPLMKPAILVALLFRTLDAFRVFDTVFIQTQGANKTETVSILGYHELITRLNIGEGSAISVLIFAMVILIAEISTEIADPSPDRKSTRLNSSHSQISYAVFCLKKKKQTQQVTYKRCTNKNL